MVDEPSTVLYYPTRLSIPPLSPAHVHQILNNSVQSGNCLPYSIATYLKELAFEHLKKLINNKKYLIGPPSKRDLVMLYLGQHAPLATIIAASFLLDKDKNRYYKEVVKTCLPLKCKEFRRYNVILLNRIHEGTRQINPNDESSYQLIFDYLCDHPYYTNSDHSYYKDNENFESGCEISKLLYSKAVEEIGKILSFNNWK